MRISGSAMPPHGRHRINPVEFVAFAASGESNYRIAERFGVHESTVRRGLRDIGYKRHLLPTDHPTRYEFDLDKPIVRTAKKIMVTSDWHIPVYDHKYVNEMILTARDQGITKLVIGGDYFNYDSLSQYDPKQTDAGLYREHTESMAVMRVILETFDEIDFIWGNHDARMHKALGFKMRFAEAMRMVFGTLGEAALDRIQFSNLDHMIVKSGGEDFYIAHPQNYNATPLATARKLANKVNMNVITAHSHHAAIGFAEDGHKIVAEAGGLFDRSKTEYLKRTTTFPTWTQGFLWVDSGTPHLWTPRWEVN